MRAHNANHIQEEEEKEAGWRVGAGGGGGGWGAKKKRGREMFETFCCDFYCVSKLDFFFLWFILQASSILRGMKTATLNVVHVSTFDV